MYIFSSALILIDAIFRASIFAFAMFFVVREFFRSLIFFVHDFSNIFRLSTFSAAQTIALPPTSYVMDPIPF